jgi:hypothetical protein
VRVPALGQSDALDLFRRRDVFQWIGAKQEQVGPDARLD